MTVTNDFLPFATGAGANVLSQSDYAALAARPGGFIAGVANSAQLNKAWRQGSVIAALIGQFINDIGGYDALDDGSVTNLLTSFERTLQKQKLNSGTAGGTANALTLTLVPAPDALVYGMPIRVKASADNTGAATINVNGLGAKAITNPDGSAVGANRLKNGRTYEMIYTGTDFVIVSSPGAATQAEVDDGTRNDVFVSPATAKAAVRVFDCTMVASQNLPNNTMTTPTINTATENGLVDSTTFSTAKLTIGARDAGFWSITAYIQYTGDGANKSLRIHRNGASTSYSANSRMGIFQNGSGSSNDTYTVTANMRLAAGDQVSADVLHTIGSTQTLTNGRFICTRLSS